MIGGTGTQQPFGLSSVVGWRSLCTDAGPPSGADDDSLLDNNSVLAGIGVELSDFPRSSTSDVDARVLRWLPRDALLPACVERG